jgi:hypothetical protein
MVEPADLHDLLERRAVLPIDRGHADDADGGRAMSS